jgi:hypothetical protein
MSEGGNCLTVHGRERLESGDTRGTEREDESRKCYVGSASGGGR